MIPRCESTTPFGIPVVPEVKSITAGSSSRSTAGSCFVFDSREASSRTHRNWSNRTSECLDGTFGAHRSSVSTIVGRVSANACMSSEPLHHAFPRTTTASTCAIAQNETTHSMELAPRSRTRSPEVTPRDSRKKGRHDVNDTSMVAEGQSSGALHEVLAFAQIGHVARDFSDRPKPRHEHVNELASNLRRN
jgi:hypothetical protein